MTRAMHRVLIVEDNPAISRVLEMSFEANGFRVITADTCELGVRQAQTHLTPLEHRILECLARHADSVVTHTQVMKEVWGPHQIDGRSLRVYVASLRRKLEVDPGLPPAANRLPVGHRA